MFIEADRVLKTLIHEFNKLMPSLTDSDTQGSAGEAIIHALRLLQAREVGGQAAMHDQFSRLADVLDKIEAAGIGISADMLASTRVLISSSRTLQNLTMIEECWKQAVSALQALVVQTHGADVDGNARRYLLDALVAWETDDLLSQLPRPEAGSEPEGEAERDSGNVINSASLTIYLRDRFDDPKLEVTGLQPLAGGFGKETTFFAVRGSALAGDYVIRRDVEGAGSLSNDCHQVAIEYPLIRAVFERGFPAPDALWLDTEHKLLRGGHFIVMRRAPGRLSGNFFGAQKAVPDELSDILADKMAELHAMPPLYELGDLSDSIRTDLWNIPLGECVRRYIANWYTFYLSEQHAPSPSIVALFGWLLDNVPDRSGRPRLLHGDIGFHNFLLHEDRMSVLLDWEFAHIGDPAEELGYIKVTVGGSLNWDRLMARYRAAGGIDVDARTLDYFQIWAYVRNAAAANLISTQLTFGLTDDLKVLVLPYFYIPRYISSAQALIDKY